MAPELRSLLCRMTLSGLLTLLASAPAHALRVVTYNILNYPSTIPATREPAYRTILAALDPDVIVVQEMTSAAGTAQFLDNVLNNIQPAQWDTAAFVSGPDTQNGFFYKKSRVSYLGQTILPTALRNIAVYRLRLAGYGSEAAELRLFSMHLKASMGYEQNRLAEATVARNYANGLPAGTNFIYCGDLNTYTGSEPCYQKFLASESDNDGRAKDVINRVGAWNNNGSFADVHTQSTRTGTLTPGDGGATGGLDDRFDHLILSYALDDGEGMDWIPGTYKAFGNDAHHFNLDINSPPANTAVTQDVANALQRASDHLPVAVDLQAPALGEVNPLTLDFGRVLVGTALSPAVSVTNVATAPADELDYGLVPASGFSTPAGPFQLGVGASRPHAITLDTSTSGLRSGNLTVNSDDPEHPAVSVALSGHVLDSARPSLESDAETLARTIDWGVQPAGGFDPRRFAVYDYGFGADRAGLEISSVALSGGDGHFTVTSPPGDPIAVGADSAEFAVAFHDSGATSDSLYEATLTLGTRDESGAAGAAARAPIVVTLRATVGGVAVGIGEPPLPARTALGGTWPNPASRGFHLDFELARASQVRADLFDVQGRWVSEVARGTFPPGRHEVAWSAKHGEKTSAGVYFLHFSADGLERVRRVVLLPGGTP